MRPSSRIEVAIRTRLSVGWVSHLWIELCHSSIELAENEPDAVTPCGSSRQPITLMQSATLAEIPRMYSSVLVEARLRPAVERGSCSGTSLHAMPESTSEEGTGSRLP